MQATRIFCTGLHLLVPIGRYVRWASHGYDWLRFILAAQKRRYRPLARTTEENNRRARSYFSHIDRYLPGAT